MHGCRREAQCIMNYGRHPSCYKKDIYIEWDTLYIYDKQTNLTVKCTWRTRADHIDLKIWKRA